MRYFAILLSGCIGFLSLSQEILWVRLVSFMNQGTPQAFAEVLCIFLFGIAAGAAAGRRLCEKSYDLVVASGAMLLLSSAVDMTIVFIPSTGDLVSILCVPVLIFGSALLKSSLFPIVHHLGSANSRRGLGISVSIVYYANIIGSTLGPLITGFVVLDHLGLRQTFLCIGIADLFLASACFAVARSRTALGLASTAAVASLFIPGMQLLPSPSYSAQEVKRIIENRHGIIHVHEGGISGDAIFGGNVYDGRINTDLLLNSNGIHRVYILAALHNAPKRILLIGLSGGSWTKILSGMEGIEHIDAIEINSGYLDLIRSYPEVSDILTNPKIKIVIDDGRRWLKRNPGNKYDLIVMNTTYHWRSYSSNLLSIEFLRLLRNHMNLDAIVTFNSTGSMDTFKTAVTIFPHAYLYDNFIIAGNDDFRRNLPGGFDRVARMRWDTRPIFDLQRKADVDAIRKMLTVPFRTFAEIQQGSPRLYEVITEQNMITEYKYGRGL